MAADGVGDTGYKLPPAVTSLSARLLMLTVAFVMFPLSGTGAIGGSLFSQILGMSRIRALFAILCGAVIGSFGLAYLADTVLPEDVQDSWLFKLGGLLFILIIVWILTKLYKRIDPEAIKDEQ